MLNELERVNEGFGLRQFVVAGAYLEIRHRIVQVVNGVSQLRSSSALMIAICAVRRTSAKSLLDQTESRRNLAGRFQDTLPAVGVFAPKTVRPGRRVIYCIGEIPVGLSQWCSISV